MVYIVGFIPIPGLLGKTLALKAKTYKTKSAISQSGGGCQPISNMKMPSCILNFLTYMNKVQIEALHLQGGNVSKV